MGDTKKKEWQKIKKGKKEGIINFLKDLQKE